MKQITIGEISISSEDGDTWEKLLKVMKDANKIYFKSIKEGEEHWIIKLVRKITGK